MNAYTLKEPQQWKAGSLVKDGQTQDFYFDCADCGEKDAKIAGFLGEEPGDFAHMAILERPSKSGLRTDYHPAMFCAPCWAVRMAEIDRQAAQATA